MKLLKLTIALCIILLCTATLKAQTADEIVAKSIAAIGGKEAWKKIRSIRQEGIIDQNGTEIKLNTETLHNKGTRTTIALNGMSGYSIITPTEGWSYYPWQGQKPEAMTQEDIKESQEGLDVQGTLIDYKEKGHKIEYIGTDDFEGTDCLKLKVIAKSGVVTTYYIDPANYLIIHAVTLTKANGQERESKTDYSNYQKFPEGIWLPMNITNYNTLKIKKVEINTPLDESFFKIGK